MFIESKKSKLKCWKKNDILKPETMVQNIGKNHLTIGNYKNMTNKFNINNIGSPVKRMVRFNGVIKILAKFKTRIKILPAKRDFMFIPKKKEPIKK